MRLAHFLLVVSTAVWLGSSALAADRNWFGTSSSTGRSHSVGTPTTRPRPTPVASPAPSVRPIATGKPTAPAAPVHSAWMTSLDDAKRAAASSKRPILVDFAGSDWCAWCKRLDEEVFKQQEFLDWAAKKVVLCVLDFPRDPKKVTEQQRAKNQEAAELYSVRGYPTVLLLESDGTLIGRTGYRQGGARAYIQHLDEVLTNCQGWQRRLADLEVKKGPERVALAAHLFKHCAEVLGDDVVRVAAVLFTDDPKDTSDMRSDGALILAGIDHPLAKQAEAHLAAIAANDKKKRYGFLLFTRTTEEFRQLLATAGRNKGSELSSPEVKEQAVKLYKQLKAAKTYVPNQEMAANIYMRMAVALACGGKRETALKSLAKAGKLGVPEPMLTGYRRFIEDVR